METMATKFHLFLKGFKSYHGGPKDVITNNSPSDKYIVIDELPSRDRATYMINSNEGWIVFSMSYKDDTVVYPTVYGILFRKLDIDLFSNATLHGMPVDDIYKICEATCGSNFNDILNGVGT